MEADFGMTQQAFAPNEGESKLFVQFYMAPKENQTKSREAGRPIYDDVPFVRIMVPGDKDNVIDRPAREYDMRRFPRQYAAFKNGMPSDTATSGTPLSAWPVVTRGQVEEMAFFGVRTVEQLAEMSDANAQKFLGINTLRQKARDFLEAAKDSGALTKLRTELEDRDVKIADLTRVVEKLTARLDEIEKG